MTKDLKESKTKAQGCKDKPDRERPDIKLVTQKRPKKTIEIKVVG